jgi:hypothetical protein
MIKICRKSPDEARQGSIPSGFEHGLDRGEEGSASAISGRENQGKGGCHRRRTTTEDGQA